MMSKDTILLFGYNDFTKEILKQLTNEHTKIHIYTMDKRLLREGKTSGYNISLFDLGDEWNEISSLHDTENLRVFRTLENDAENIFLTISLRAAFENIYIIALARNQESVNKLKIAGANKVMRILQTTANIITEYLQKPAVLETVHNLLYGESDVLLEEITIGESSPYIGQTLEALESANVHNIIILAVQDSTFKTHFSVTKKGSHHRLTLDDILIVIGYNDKLKAFEHFVEGK